MYVAIDIEQGFCIAFNKSLYDGKLENSIGIYLEHNPDVEVEDIRIYSMCSNLVVRKREVKIVDLVKDGE